jgi:hypothetical protein
VNFIQDGKLSWRSNVASGNGYAEFIISGTRVDSNIAWLITLKLIWIYKKMRSLLLEQPKKTCMLIKHALVILLQILMDSM